MKLRRVFWGALIVFGLLVVVWAALVAREFVDGFGQTEISNVFMTPPGAPRPPGASGVLVDQWFEVRLADPETGEPVPEGQAGELLVRHKHPGIISTEYLGMPDKTIESRRDLWFHTGDALRRMTPEQLQLALDAPEILFGEPLPHLTDQAGGHPVTIGIGH